MLGQIPEEHHKVCKDISDKVLRELKGCGVKVDKVYESEYLWSGKATRVTTGLIVKGKFKGSHKKLYINFETNNLTGAVVSKLAIYDINKERYLSDYLNSYLNTNNIDLQNFFQDAANPSDVEASEFYECSGKRYILSEGSLREVIKEFYADEVEFHTIFSAPTLKERFKEYLGKLKRFLI